jgi:hypothetical protein
MSKRLEPADRSIGHVVGVSQVIPVDARKPAPEATAGIEPAMKVLQTSALPLGYVADE